jgi:hypothetical protein
MFLSEFMHVHGHDNWAHGVFLQLSNRPNIGTADKKRAATMNNTCNEVETKYILFVHGEVQFNSQHQTKAFYFVALKFAGIL